MIVDASVWSSAELGRELDHHISLEWRERQIRRGVSLFIPSLALTEVAGAVARATGDVLRGAEAVRTMEAIRSLKVFPLGDELMKHATALAARLRLRGADAVYVALAHRRGLPLVTWDSEVRERAAPLVRVVRPG